MQALQLAFRHRVKVDAANPLVRTRPLQPTQKDLGSAWIRDCPFSQASLDLHIARRFAITTCCTAGGEGGTPARAGLRRAQDPRRDRPTIVNQLLHKPRDAGPLDTLTERERDVLEAMAEGYSNQAIGRRLLFLSTETM
jgi:hypothetical protein